MTVVSWDGPLAAILAWGRVVEDQLHERFYIDYFDAREVSALFLDDVGDWVASWDKECLQELRSSLEYLLIQDVDALGAYVIGNQLDDPEVLIEGIWLPLFRFVFHAEPQVRPRELFEIKNSTAASAQTFANRLPPGPFFAWDTSGVA